MPVAVPHRRRPGPLPGRVAMVSMHTSPLHQPGTGDGGGLNVYLLELSRRLADAGVAVDVLTRADEPGLAPEVTVAPGLRVHHLPAGPEVPLAKSELTGLVGTFVAAARERLEGRVPDLVHGHYWLSGWAGTGLAADWGVPFVQTFHTYGLMKNATLAPGDVPEPLLRLRVEREVAQAADLVLSMTCDEARLLHRDLGLGGGAIAVVPAGVDTTVFRPDGLPAPIDRLPPGSGPLLLFVGRLQPLKGPEVAVATLAAVRASVPDARLLMVGGASGDGPGATAPAELRRLARSLGVESAVRVVPAVPQAELARYYRSADVVLVPSRSETFGLVALEAQASGTPVVAADVSGLRATVRRGGTRVPGHAPADHAAAVVRYLRDPALVARTADQGILAGRRASWGQTAERLLVAYATVGGRPARLAS